MKASRLFMAPLLLCAVVAIAQLQGKVQLTGKTIVQVTGHSVTLNWVASADASTYNMYRATTRGGPYTKIATGITGISFTDTSNLVCRQQLYYVVTAVNASTESGYSNEAAVTIP